MQEEYKPYYINIR
ncbi:uncharacterized protein FFNC_11974 [Fusarium fujikuroi]|nr:uncharacterized protein FFNC_11974 [Fusarium fujikuroi]